MQCILLVVSASVIEHAWSAGQRQNPAEISSPFVWRLTSASDYIELPVNYTNWDVNEPDNLAQEQCIALNRDRNHAWFDAFCSNRYKSVCEIRIA